MVVGVMTTAMAMTMAIRRTAEEQNGQSPIRKTYNWYEQPDQQAIFTLLERDWFQRIWVLQEVSAARHVLIKCGPAEIDRFALRQPCVLP